MLWCPKGMFLFTWTKNISLIVLDNLVWKIFMTSTANPRGTGVRCTMLEEVIMIHLVSPRFLDGGFIWHSNVQVYPMPRLWTSLTAYFRSRIAQMLIGIFWYAEVSIHMSVYTLNIYRKQLLNLIATLCVKIISLEYRNRQIPLKDSYCAAWWDSFRCSNRFSRTTIHTLCCALYVITCSHGLLSNLTITFTFHTRWIS